MEIRNFEPREYQKAIVETCKSKNTLVCLPTGTGKTKIAIILGTSRLNLYPGSKVLVCSPTRPLSSQIMHEFKESTSIDQSAINLVTGTIKPKDRKTLWESSQVIVATPQTIKNDVEKGRISLKSVSLLCIDECHRSKQKYANTLLARWYCEQADNPRVLALTASPGSTKDKIQEICNNLKIDAVEVRTETDADMQQYIQERDIDYIKLDLTPEIADIAKWLKEVYKEKTSGLQRYGMYKPAYAINKKDLLMIQNRLRYDINNGNKAAFSGISIVAQALKVSYAIELLETQSLISAYSFLENLKQETTKAAKVLLADRKVVKAIEKLSEMIKGNKEHPKIQKIKDIVQQKLQEDKKTKIMIFANYRNTVSLIEKHLKDVPNASPTILIGQKGGLTQKKQLETIKNFEQGIHNILIGTSITEEGINIAGGANIAIFYDIVPSEIRKIQRMGRVGRMMKGGIIFLITKKTRDEAFFWSSKRKESAMKSILHEMQSKNNSDPQLKLNQSAKW